MARSLLFVGSLGLADADAAFRALGATVGPLAARYPDGEPGERAHWIMWQERVVSEHPAFERIPESDAAQVSVPSRTRRKKENVDWSDVHFEKLGYADEAIQSYDAFASLRSAGIVPKGTRFQVSLPTPVAFLTAFITPSDAAECEPIYEAAMKREIDAMTAAIPPSDLAIQWDVAHEVIAQDGGLELFYESDMDNHLDRLVRLCSYVPGDVELGIHLCYGDPGHKHVIEPKDLGTCVKFSNELMSRAPRQIDWLHMPVPRERDDDGYFQPLSELKETSDCEIYLGLLHYTDGEAGARNRMAAADKYLGSYGIATECGFGRRDRATITPLLQLHRQVASED